MHDSDEGIPQEMAPRSSQLQPGLHAAAPARRAILRRGARKAKILGQVSQNIEPRPDTLSRPSRPTSIRQAHPAPGPTSQKTEASLVFELHLQELYLPFVPEFRFCPERKWRADYLVCKVGQPCLLVEIDGGVWVQGRHTRGAGFVNDMEKHNNMALGGFFLMRFTPQQVLDGTAKQYVRRFYGL
jgi:hypothetical protein